MSFHPEKTDEFKSIFETYRKLIAGFEGCLHVELLQDRQHPHVFFTYSIWEHENFLELYRDSDLFANVWSKTKILFNDKPQAWTLNELVF